MLKELKRRAAPMHPALLMLGGANIVEVLCLSYLGQEHLLAYGLVLPLLLLLDAIGLGLGAAAASLFAHTDSAGKVQVLHSSLLWSIATGLMLTAVLLLVCELVCGDESPAIPYILFWAPSIPFALLNLCAFALLRAADRSALAAKGIILGATLQIFLTPILIFGVGRLPAMGISGAALAHTMAAITVSATLLHLAKIRPGTIHISTKGFRGVGRTLAKIALPAALSNLSVPLGAALLMTLLHTTHEGYVAAFALALRIEGFCLVAFYAYSSVIGPIAVAQRQNSQAAFFSQLKTCCRQCLAIGAGLAGAVALLPLTVDFWLTSCPDSVIPLQQYFWTVPLSYGAYGVVMLANGVFNGVGRPYCGLLVSAMRCVILLWPLAMLLNQSWPGHGIYIAIALSNFLSALAAYFFLKRTCVLLKSCVSALPHQPFERKIL